ncbi:MAG: hypothetical protein WB510_08650 [Candidatus Sulfotelmatobacter sp.]
MKLLLPAGLVLVILGIASLVVPIPHTETQGTKAGDNHSEHASPIISAVLSLAGSR